MCDRASGIKTTLGFIGGAHMAILSEEAKKLGITVGWDPTTKNVTVGDKTYTPDQLKGAGLTMANGRWQGDVGSILNQPTQVPAPATMVSPQPATTVQPTQSLDDQILATKKAQTIKDLENVYGKNVSTLNTELSTIAPTYAQKKSDVRVQNTLSAADFEKFLMQKGLGQSGSAAQGEIASNVALQGSLGQLNTAEANALADIEKRRSQLATDLEYGKQSATGAYDLASLEAQRQANILAEERAREDAAIAKSDTAAAETKKVNDFLATIGRFYQDYSAQINAVKNDNDPSNDWQIPYLEQAKQEKIINNNLDPKTGKPIQQIQVAELTPSVAMELWQTLGTSTPAIAKALGVNEGQQFPVQYAQYTGGSSGSSGSTLSQAQAIARWKATGFADDVVSQYFGVPVGSKFGEVTPQQTTSPLTETSPNTNLAPLTVNDVLGKLNSTDKRTLANQWVSWAARGQLANLTDADFDAIASKLSKLGISEQDFFNYVDEVTAKNLIQ